MATVFSTFTADLYSKLLSKTLLQFNKFPGFWLNLRSFRYCENYGSKLRLVTTQLLRWSQINDSHKKMSLRIIKTYCGT